MKCTLVIIICFSSFLSFSQQDSIVSFYNKEKKLVTNKNEAHTFEVLTKENDTIWKSRKYRKNGSIYNLNYYTSSDRKIKIGESILYDKKGKAIVLTFYNEYGQKHGPFKKWFANGSIDTEGKMYKGKREGVFKTYHYNGVLAAQAIFKSDSLTRQIYYNEKGEITPNEHVVFRQEPTFKGGYNEFKKQLKSLKENISYKVEGLLTVNFVIDIDGNITDVTVDEEVPKKLSTHIAAFYEGIKGWSPLIDKNRRVPYTVSQPITFK